MLEVLEKEAREAKKGMWADPSFPNELGEAQAAQSKKGTTGMSNILTALTSLAVSVFREKSKTSRAVPDWLGSFLRSDPVLQKAQHREYRREPLDPSVLFPEGRH